MAKAINSLTYIISAICFSVILVIGAGYIKFMSLQPGSVTVNIIQNDSKDYAEIVLEKNNMCDILVDYPYSRINYFMSNDKIILPIDSPHTTFVPVSVKYECKFLVFHKIGNELMFAQIN